MALNVSNGRENGNVFVHEGTSLSNRRSSQGADSSVEVQFLDDGSYDREDRGLFAHLSRK